MVDGLKVSTNQKEAVGGKKPEEGLMVTRLAFSFFEGLWHWSVPLELGSNKS